MKKTGYLFATVSVLCATFFYGCSQQPSFSERGGIWKVYERECQKCHKANGKGRLVGKIIYKIPNFTNPKWQDNASDSRLIIAVANGKRKMPGFKGKLEDEEIVDLVKTCVRSFYPKEP